VLPCCGVPVTTGTPEFDGGDDGAAATMLVWAESAEPAPAAFDAVTTARTAFPTSADCNI
jgi:hypothetical protein